MTEVTHRKSRDASVEVRYTQVNVADLYLLDGWFRS